MNHTIPTQLTLGISLNDEATLENYLVAEKNRELVASLLDTEANQSLVFLWGTTGSGLTHLLQAVCHSEMGREHTALYLPLKDRDQFSPEILEGCNTLSMVCLDDVDTIAGNDEWEAALFTAFNAMTESGTRLILASTTPPTNLQFALPDLQSRLQLAPVFQLKPLDDGEKKQLLQLRANKRGMELSDQLAEYILVRTERSLVSLMEVLDKLDVSSLTQRRALTIPLVRETMDWD